MERVGEWRLIEADESVSRPEPPTPANTGRTTSWRLSALLAAAAALGAVGVAIWATLPQGGIALDVAEQGVSFDANQSARLPAAAALPTGEPPLVVDVEGAIVRPGVHELRPGSRVADAIAAAGGYSTQVDIAATEQALNLAERVTDGQKIHVPARGEGQTLPGSATTPPGVALGLIDINHASGAELESLPGIGPVTAAKIMAAREQQPFGSIDELDARDVVGPSTLEQIRDLITVAP